MTDIDHSRMAILRVTPEAIGKLLQLPKGAYVEGICTEDHLGYVQFRIRGAGWPVSSGALIPVAPAATVKTREARPEDMVHSIDWNLP